jgi:hypothetical protein
MRHWLGTFLVIGLILGGADRARAGTDEEIQEARENLVLAAELQAEIGRRLGDPQIVALGESAAGAWATVASSGIRMLFPEKDNGLPRLEKLRWQTDRMSDILDSLAPSPTHRRNAADDPDWPVADCSLTGAGDDGPTWAQYMDAVYATDAAAITFQAASINCEQIIIEPIEIVDPFVFENPVTCSGAMEGFIVPDPFEPLVCSMQAAGAPFGQGMVVEGGELVENPAAALACQAAADGLTAAEKTQETIETFMDCQASATAEANYDRLDVIQTEVEAMQGFVTSMRRLLFEHALAIRGGSRMATFYLDSDHEGLLAETGETVTTAADQTEAVGYRMAPRIPSLISDAEEERSQGNVKRAYDNYREAYKLSTRKSLELESEVGGTP